MHDAFAELLCLCGFLYSISDFIFDICRILDDTDIDDSALVAGEQPTLMGTFLQRAAAEDTPYLSILKSIYFFQASSLPKN